MIKLTTDKGKTLDVNYVLNPRGDQESLIISLADDRAISVIAAELEGCASIKCVDENSPRRTDLYDGFTKLKSIQELSTGSVRVVLAQP